MEEASTYYQVKLHPESRGLTAFITREGLFRFKRICFGLASAALAFQQIMTKILEAANGLVLHGWYNYFWEDCERTHSEPEISL